MGEAAPLAARFFLEVAVILLACRLCGRAARRIGQPQVVGEIIAGIALGPSLLGRLLPELQGAVFGQDTRPILHVVSQLGLVLYMFVVGLEFDLPQVRRQARSAVSVALAGVLAPLLLGGMLAWSVHANRELFPAGVPLVTAMLFLGTAMAVTALPVLARILQEHGLLGSSLGALALAAGLIDDAIAWCLLAVVLATLSGTAAGALLAGGGGLAYVALVVGLRRLADRSGAWAQGQQTTGPAVGGVLILLMLGAWFTDTVGIHAVFGAFVLGAAIPRGALAQHMRQAIEPVTVSLLLPLFFAYSGLNTQLGLVATPALWGLALVVIGVACAGKALACWAAARLSRVGAREALAIGALMNARGLMELIMLNIARAEGLIEPALFSILVLMAIVTTMMTAPLLGRLYRRPARPPLPGEPAVGPPAHGA